MTRQTRDFRRDTWLYAVIGSLSAAQAYVSAGELPARWGPVIGITLAGLVAIKAKLSNGHPTDAQLIPDRSTTKLLDSLYLGDEVTDPFGRRLTVVSIGGRGFVDDRGIEHSGPELAHYRKTAGQGQ